MKWVPDLTGRFKWRPYYNQEELDIECERLITDFLKDRYGERRLPLSTDDLCVLIERDTSDLDLYADLSTEGEDVEGLTEFFPNRKPAVKIARELSIDSRRHNRLRTTLAHEYGHVKFHSFLWDFGFSKQSGGNIIQKLPVWRRRYGRFRKAFSSRYVPRSYFSALPGIYDKASLIDYEPSPGFRCKQSRIIDAPVSDWMEWQASYVCGAILMPLTHLRCIIRASCRETDFHSWIPSNSPSARELIVRIAESFDVPADAAQVRLKKLGFLQDIEPSDSLLSDREQPVALLCK